MNKGSCLCGDITWEIDGELTLMTACHCSMCRKVHGGAFGTYIGVEAESFRWTAGADLVHSYESSPGAQRPFCPRCGSLVASETPDGGQVYMPAGNLEGDLDRALDSHIFVDSRASWHEITDEAPQFGGYPPGYGGDGVEQPDRPPATAGAVGGSCLCGAVAFEFDTTLERMGSCHCSRCRKSRSSAHSVQLFVAADQFRWVRGESEIRSFKVPEAEFFVATFCGTCSSPMPVVFADRGVAMVPAGALDQDPGIRPQAHIFVASKAPWFEITDEPPQFEEMPENQR